MHVTQVTRAIENCLASAHAVMKRQHGAEIKAPVIECWNGGEKVSVSMKCADKIYGRRPAVAIDVPFSMLDGAELNYEIYEQFVVELFSLFIGALNQYKYERYGRPKDLHKNLSPEAKRLKNQANARIFDATAAEEAKVEMQANPNETMELEGNERFTD